MKRLFSFLFISIISFQFCKAQNLNHKATIVDTHTESWNHRLRNALTDLKYKKNKDSKKNSTSIIGSEYNTEVFSLGRLFVEDKILPVNFSLRYNAYIDEIEISTDSVTEYLIRDEKISCLIGKEKFIFRKYSDNNSKTKIGYLTVIIEGNNFMLLARKTKKLKEAKKAKTSMTSSFPAKFISKESFYFSDKSKNTTFIKNNKTLLELIDQNFQSQMKAFIKQNKVNTKKEKNLILFFEHYNSLL